MAALATLLKLVGGWSETKKITARLTHNTARKYGMVCVWTWFAALLSQEVAQLSSHALSGETVSKWGFLGGETPEETTMEEDGPARTASEGTRLRRGAVGSADVGAANANQQNGEGIAEVSTRESLAGLGRLALAAKTMERRNSAPQGSYQRYMPMEVLKMPIPRKTKEKRGNANVPPSENNKILI